MTPNKKKLLVLERMEQQRGRCIWCATPMWFFHYEGKYRSSSERATIEHLVPKAMAKGGPEGSAENPQNLVLSCALCNMTRGSNMFTYKPVASVMSGLPLKVTKHIQRFWK